MSDNLSLYARIVAGDRSARDEMILANMDFARTIVTTWLRTHQAAAYLTDDLHGKATEVLVVTVDGFISSNEQIDSPRAFIKTAIHNAISALAMQDALLSGSKRTQMRRIEAGKPAKLLQRKENIHYKKDDDRDPEAELFAFDDGAEKLVETRELLNAACKDDVDRQLMDLRERGYIDSEVAAEMGLSESTVGSRRRKIEKRFVELGGPPRTLRKAKASVGSDG